MSADGSIGGWESLRAPLNPAVIDPVGIPLCWHIGVSSQQVYHLLGVGRQVMGAPLFWCAPSSFWTDGSKAAASVSWAVGCKTVAVGTHLCLLDGGRLTDMEGSGWVMAPCRMLYRSLVFDPATANSTCWRSLVSRCSISSHRHSASHCRKLTWHNWCSP